MTTLTRTLVLTLSLAAATCSPAIASGAAQAPGFAQGGIISGTFVATSLTDSVGGIDDLNVFDAIRGRTIRFTIAFDAIEHEDNAPLPEGGRRRILTTSPAQVNFFGDPTGYLQHTIAPTLRCPLQIAIHEDAEGTVFVDGFDISDVVGAESFGFKAGSNGLSAAGAAPSLQSADLDTDVMVLQRFGVALTMTDLATGSVRYVLFDNVAVGVQPRAFGEVKAMYRTLR